MLVCPRPLSSRWVMNAGSSWWDMGQSGGGKAASPQMAPQIMQHFLLRILIDRVGKRAVDDAGCLSP